MEDVKFLELVLAVVVGGIVPAVWTVATVRASIDGISNRIERLSKEINKAHDRIDDHITSFHAHIRDL